jgi:hypothetical protein
MPSALDPAASSSSIGIVLQRMDVTLIRDCPMRHIRIKCHNYPKLMDFPLNGGGKAGGAAAYGLEFKRLPTDRAQTALSPPVVEQPAIGWGAPVVTDNFQSILANFRYLPVQAVPFPRGQGTR